MIVESINRKIRKGLEFVVNVLRYVTISDIPRTIFGKAGGPDYGRIKLRDGTDTSAPVSASLLRNLEFRKEMVDQKYKIFRWDIHGKVVFANNDQIGGLSREYLAGEFESEYQGDFGGKVVLDVGGYVGDTAMFFFDKGAKRVIIYEAVEENVATIRHNLSDYVDRYEVYTVYVSDKDGKREIQSDAPVCSTGFGEKPAGRHTLLASCISMENILKRNRMVDVAKIDCEGCEYNLEKVDNETIREIPWWIIEFHFVSENQGRLRRIMDKFGTCGFGVTKKIPIDSDTIVYHLKMPGEAERTQKQT